MVSIKDIARDCDVSIATVSKAINNHSDVSDKTKAIVLESAKRLGYMPNSQARSLKTNKTYNVGVLYYDKASRGLTHSFFSIILSAFKEEIGSLGYDVTFISSQVGDMQLTFLEHCRYRNVDGAVIVCADYSEFEIQELLGSDLPLVAVDYRADGVLSVMSDNTQGIGRLAEYLHSKNHRKIAYIYGDHAQVTDLRIAAFKSTLAGLGVALLPEYVKESKYLNPDLTEKAVYELLDLPDPPTAIILPDDYAALGAYNACRARGLQIPIDISLVGYDGIEITQTLKPSLTTFRQDAALIGKYAAGLLNRRIKGEVFAENQRVITVKGTFIEGETVSNVGWYVPEIG